ncbi:MAG: site-specific integrase [Chloroflexi bacterium]|nr:site-specific integrase [Chloroflexota bacterium]
MKATALTAKTMQREVLDAELSENTRAAYRKGWDRFVDYCVAEQIPDPLSASPEEVARFFVHVATHPSPRSGVAPSMGTVMIYKSAVNKKYAESGKSAPANHPVVGSTLKGLARLKGSAPRKVEALREYHIAAMLRACPDSPIGKRDAAIIATGFAGALRRSEICALSVDDIEFLDEEDRMWLTIRRSKTDQQGRGHRIAVQDGDGIRPVGRLKQYLRGSGITEGPLFQTMRRGGHLRGRAMHHSDIPRIVKHYAALIGLNPSNIAGHSLRAGFVTSAAVHRARLDKIMAVTRHKSPATVMGYIRDVDAFADHAGQGFL